MALKNNLIKILGLSLALALDHACSKGPRYLDFQDTDEVLRFQKNDCGFSGRWKNELNSTVILRCTNGQLRGTYSSAVGNASDFYILSGRYTMTGEDAVVGWSVAWNNTKGNSRSTTSWTGLYYNATDTIYTQWILAIYNPINQFWKAFITNQDQFIRVKYSP